MTTTNVFSPRAIGSLAPRASRRFRRQRRGGMIVLLAIMMSVVVVLCAISVNLAWVELAQTELRAVTDSAARAAMVDFGKSQSVTSARNVAKTVASRNKVGGASFILANSDVVFGRAVRQNDDSYVFTVNQTPTNACRVVGSMTNGSTMGQFGTVMRGIAQPDQVDLNGTTIAVRVDNDIAVVVDRSGSMSWDLSGTPYRYPSEQPGGEAGNDIQYYFTKPHATQSRWANLTSALDAFQQAVEDRDIAARMALVSYASQYQFGQSQWSSQLVTTHMPPSGFAVVGSSAFVDTDVQTSPINDKVRWLVTAAKTVGQQPLIGGTDIGAGMTRGRDVLKTDPGQRNDAMKTMIVLTDGNRTQGMTAAQIISYAAACKAEGITVYTITFSEDGGYTTMQSAAAAGGGKHYHAQTYDQLRQAFIDIAGTLPVMIVQ